MKEGEPGAASVREGRDETMMVLQVRLAGPPEADAADQQSEAAGPNGFGAGDGFRRWPVALAVLGF